MVKNGPASLNNENDSMRFDAFEAEDFLQEQSFLNYCIATNEEDVRFWNDWISTHPGRETAAKQARELYFMLNGNSTAKQFASDEQEFIAAFGKHTGEPLLVVRKGGGAKKAWWYSGVAAASVLLAFFLYSIFMTDRAGPSERFAYKTPNAAVEKKPVILPDGSSVTLNSGSVIRLATDFNDNTRELTLEGEGFFRVAHNADKPFIIHTAAMDVKVLGTVFNVKAYPADRESETSLISGSVEVTVQKDHHKIILSPNQKVTLLNDAPTTLPKDGNDYHVAPLTKAGSGQPVELSWTQNKLVFRDNNFEDISHELERWYNVRLVFEDEAVKKFRYSATFENKKIDEVLAALQLSRHFSFRRDNSNVIRISSQQ
jgi:ferric-dicitrate binding protein FerR (iron transport regulator)